MSDTKTVRVIVTGDSSSAKSAMRSLQSEVKKTDSHMGGLGATMGKWAMRGTVALGAVTAGAGILGFKTAVMYEQANVAFKKMLGGAQQAKDFMGQLRDFAKNTPFELKDLVKNSQMLMAMGFKAKQVIPTLTAIGDAAAGTGRGAESISYITRALGQMMAKGKVSGEELRQLSEQNIKGLQILADNYGVTTGQMQKMIEKGIVPSAKAVPMLIEAMEKGTKNVQGFGGMMEEQSKTMGGAISNLKDVVTDNLAILVGGSFGVGTKAVRGLTDALDSFFKGLVDGKGPAEGISGPLNTLGLALRALGDAFKDPDVTSDGLVGLFERIGVAARGVWEWVKKVGALYREHMDIVNTFVVVLVSLITAFKVFNLVVRITSLLMAALSSPVVLVIGVLALLITWMVHLYRTNKDFRENVTAAWEAIQKAASWAWEKVLKPVFGFFGSVIGTLGKNFGSFKTGVKDAWTIISGAAKGAWAIMAVIFQAIKLGIGAVKKGFDLAKTGISLAWKGIKLAVGKPIEWVINTVLRDGIIGKFNWLASKVGIPQIKFAGVSWKYANGGVLPGYTPGRDVHSFYSPKLGRLDLSGGEAIMRPEFTRMVGGARGVAALNAMARRGFADGGVWDKVMHPYQVFSGFIGRVTSGGGIVRDLAGGIIKKLVGGFIKKIVGGVKDFIVGGGFVGGAESGTGAGVQRWTGTVMRVLMELRQPLSLVGAVLRRIQMESGGNPNAINLWDSNAKAGIPSQGLMQTVPGTFAAYAGPYRGLGITNPLANIYAGVNYALQRYGSLVAIDPRVRPYGYDQGGMMPPGLSLSYNGTGKPEPVGWGTGGIVVNVTVEGNVTTERDLVKAITLGVRDELLRHAGRNGGRTGLPPS